MSNYDRLRSVLDKVRCLDRRFVLERRDEWTYTIHVEYREADIDDPSKGETLQVSRRWLVNWDATDSDVVETAFACVMRSYDHVVREHFTYDGSRVHSPHQRLVMCGR